MDAPNRDSPEERHAWPWSLKVVASLALVFACLGAGVATWLVAIGSASGGLLTLTAAYFAAATVIAFSLDWGLMRIAHLRKVPSHLVAATFALGVAILFVCGVVAGASL